MHDIVPLHDLPLFLQQAFITAKDKHFYEHSGVDWPARVRDTTRIRKPLTQLATRLYEAQGLTASEYQQILTQGLTLTRPTLPVQAHHFLRYVRSLDFPPVLLQQGQLRTTLDASVQHRA